jgi:hypothetical protein
VNSRVRERGLGYRWSRTSRKPRDGRRPLRGWGGGQVLTEGGGKRPLGRELRRVSWMLRSGATRPLLLWLTCRSLLVLRAQRPPSSRSVRGSAYLVRDFYTSSMMTDVEGI